MMEGFRQGMSDGVAHARSFAEAAGAMFRIAAGMRREDGMCVLPEIDDPSRIQARHWIIATAAASTSIYVRRSTSWAPGGAQRLAVERKNNLRVERARAR